MGAPAFGSGGERLALGGVGRAVGVARRGHTPAVRAVLATASAAADQATLAAGLPSLVPGPLVRGAPLVGSTSALAGDLTLLGAIHRGEAAALVFSDLSH